MKPLKYFLLLLFFNSSFSQVEIDTTFTIISEYNKQLKKFPFIEFVKPLKESSLKEEKNIIYHTIEKRKLHLDSYQSISTSKLPAVLLLHGGGWKSGDKSMSEALAQQIALKGYQCFTIEYRLSDEAIYPAAVNDVLKAIEYIKNNANRFNLASNKIAILGCSSGGQIAALIGTKFSKEVQAIITIDGILAFHHSQSQEGRSAALWLGGTYEEKPYVWEDASALSHVDENTPPILFINSQFERFHAGRDEMILKMNQLNTYSKIETIEDSPHTFWLFHPWFELTIKYISSFLDEKLKF
jgi:acetyl esterase/lipase